MSGVGLPPTPTPRWVARLVGRPGVLLAFAWGFAEALLFFLVPDIVLTFAALVGGWRSACHLVAAVAGAVVGGAVLYAWAVAAPQSAMAAVDAVPFVSAGMFEQARADYARVGVWAACVGPTAGIPYKVHAVLAPCFVSLPAFLLVTIPARLERLALTWAVCVIGGHLARRPIAAHPGRLAALHASVWTAVVAWYWSVI